MSMDIALSWVGAMVNGRKNKSGLLKKSLNAMGVDISDKQAYEGCGKNVLDPAGTNTLVKKKS